MKQWNNRTRQELKKIILNTLKRQRMEKINFFETFPHIKLIIIRVFNEEKKCRAIISSSQFHYAMRQNHIPANFVPIFKCKF